MKNLFLLIISISFFSINLSAQPNTDRVSGALSEFLQTEFMRQFSDLRIKAETEMSNFMANSNMYNPQDVTRVQIAYDRTAQRFNELLDKIKQDFLDQRKLKYITRYPDSYSRGLELDIRELSDFYSQNLQQTLADVTNNQQDGSALLLLLVDLVKFSSGAIQHFSRIKAESRRYTDSYLNTNFVRPNRFKTYRELSGNGGYQDDVYNDPYNQNQNTDPYSDPYNQNNTNPYGDPYNQNNTNPYNQNQNTDPYNQNNTNPYNQNNDPYNQNQNTDPYGNYDGQTKVDSLKKDSLNKYYPVDSAKIKKDSITFQKKTNDKDGAKVHHTYEQYRKDQRKRVVEKKDTSKKKTEKKNN